MRVRTALMLSATLTCGVAAIVASSYADAPPASQPTTLPTVVIPIAGQPFTLEIADEPDEQQTGLMYRTSMSADHGMIFVFPFAEVRAFWMKNTFIPLDIIYLDDQAKVLNVEPMVPHDLAPVRSDGKARYAIELNAGTAARIGVKRGDEIPLPDALR